MVASPTQGVNVSSRLYPSIPHLFWTEIPKMFFLFNTTRRIENNENMHSFRSRLSVHDQSNIPIASVEILFLAPKRRASDPSKNKSKKHVFHTPTMVDVFLSLD